jgi:glycosyltransferase involved in cell wall biosynthesis
LGVPVIYTVNGCANLDLKTKGLKFFLENFLLTKIKYSREVSDSPHFLKYKNINKNIQIIPNGIDIQAIDKIPAKKDSIFTIISVGRLTHIKGQKMLLKAIKNLADKKVPFKLKIIGIGEDEKLLKDYVKNNKLDNFVSFLGKLTGRQLIEQYKSAHLFVLTSLAEGMPNTVLEAWGAKLPVIATKVGSLPYLINPKNGYLVESSDDEQLTEAIIKIVNNKNRQMLGNNGYELVKSRYSVDKYVQNYLNLYEEVI